MEIRTNISIKSQIEGFFKECRKARVITLTNHNRLKQRLNRPTRTRSKYKQIASSAGKRVQIRPVTSKLLLIGQESGARFCNQSQSIEKQHQSKRELPPTLH